MPLDTARIQKSIKRLDKFLKKTPRDPSPDKIHNVRTSSRRLESALETLTAPKKRLRRRLQRELATIRKRCGKLRDIDVLTADTLTVKAGGEEQQCLVQLVEHLGAKRAKHAKKLTEAARASARRTRRDLRKLADKVENLATPLGGANGLNGQKTEVLADLGAQLESPAKLNRGNLHPYRIQVKELRYALQLSEEAQNDHFVTALGEVKDAIGEWHDWEELVATAVEILGHGAQCKLIKELKRIAGEKFEKALDITNKMRTKYVAREPDRKRRGAVPLPVLVAQSSRNRQARSSESR